VYNTTPESSNRALTSGRFRDAERSGCGLSGLSGVVEWSSKHPAALQLPGEQGSEATLQVISSILVICTCSGPLAHG